jgi:hypothetical protein
VNIISRRVKEGKNELGKYSIRAGNSLYTLEVRHK